MLKQDCEDSQVKSLYFYNHGNFTSIKNAVIEYFISTPNVLFKWYQSLEVMPLDEKTTIQGPVMFKRWIMLSAG